MFAYLVKDKIRIVENAIKIATLKREYDYLAANIGKYENNSFSQKCIECNSCNIL